MGGSLQNLNYKNSLNYNNRKREQAKQIQENITMLKKIHFAKPTIKFNDYKAHEKKVDKLKSQIQTGSVRYTMMQAARDMIISTEFNNALRRSNSSFKNMLKEIQMQKNSVRNSKIGDGKISKVGMVTTF